MSVVCWVRTKVRNNLGTLRGASPMEVSWNHGQMWMFNNRFNSPGRIGNPTQWYFYPPPRSGKDPPVEGRPPPLLTQCNNFMFFLLVFNANFCFAQVYTTTPSICVYRNPSPPHFKFLEITLILHQFCPGAGQGMTRGAQIPGFQRIANVNKFPREGN